MLRRFAERPLVFKISPLALEQSARIYSVPRSADKVTFDIGTYLLRRLAAKSKDRNKLMYLSQKYLSVPWVRFIMQVRTHRSLRRRKRNLTQF